MEAEGQINASTKWLPACSFLDDTAAALLSISQMQPGIYMIDSNKKWNFFEIVSALNKKHGNKWKMAATDDFIFDQRMIDERLQVPGLKQRLKSLD